jgi:secondary thiamine-phosphate synthase enzyme
MNLIRRFDVRTKAHAEFHEITSNVAEVIGDVKVTTGTVTVYVPHTTAGLTINENADPDVKSDMLQSLEEMVPWKQPHFRHAEGNSAAHIKASMMGFSATILIDKGTLALGMWQGIYLCEFDGPRTRSVWVRIEGE